MLLPAAAAAAPTISPGDGEAWNAAEVPPTYEIAGTADGAGLVWQLETGDGVPVRRQMRGRSPLRVVLDGLADGDYQIVASQFLPADPGEAVRRFSVDTSPPRVTIHQPRGGAVYQHGARVVADYSCADIGAAGTCVGTVAHGHPIDTSAAGARTFVATATDTAGNASTARVDYRVAAPAAAIAAAPAGTPAPPSPPIRLAPPEPGDTGPTPEVLDPGLLRPPAGTRVTTLRPLLRWRAVTGASTYNLQLYRLSGDRAIKVASRFPRGSRARAPKGALSFGERYAWRVWPLVDGSFPAKPIGQSWFEVRRPVRLTPSQLLVNQRISQAALRRTAAIAEWLDAGLATGDLRDGGLGPRKFGAGVRLSGAGTPIANGLATPRPLEVTAAPRRPARLRVTGRQMLVNQRISQAAVRRANALAVRLEGGLTGGDLRPGAVTASKIAPGLRVASALPSVPVPAASRTAVAPATRRPKARVRPTARQALVNQRISQAAVRRANALAAVIEDGVTGAQFRDGAITAASLSPPLRS